ncbi:TIGR03089 family protein [Quadrisphaera sp. DSM 44207]|uniref:TIGR03089 family protein n=1 Tax=Quadrisphaera sp. DSM 44207 TaxID=1881057 RepID=UPI000883B6CD|nr:TIGR03089 family protein [Quadrisphaera sp. DSM 44207]SDQ09566.1 TIGR03089 family protein [Quadrisphaera sp. DSM 44207]
MSTPPSAPQAPRTVPQLLAALRASDLGRPRLTWYGADGERVELSARVLENWVAKTANLLVEELDAGPGTRVHLALPPHWRTAVWVLSAWAVGAEPVLAAPGASGAGPVPAAPDDADVLVSTGAAASVHGPGPLQVAVALPALARSVAAQGPLAPGVLDYNAEVGAFADSLPPLAQPADLREHLAGAPGAAGPWPPRVRLLVPAERFEPVRALLAPLAVDGSVVVLGAGAPDAERVAAQEQVTARG